MRLLLLIRIGASHGLHSLEYLIRREGLLGSVRSHDGQVET